MDKDVISHHGVPGQKWGVLRYQNRDGSLTALGRKRAQKLKEQYKSLTGKKLKGKIPEKPEDLNKKPVRKLTDMELSDRITRLTNEKKALELERDLSSNGQKFLRSVGKNVIAPAAINVGKTLLEKKLLEWGSEALGMNKKEVKSAYEQLKEEANTVKLKREKMQNENWMKDEIARRNKSNADESKQNKSNADESKQNKQNKQNTTNNTSNTFVNFNIFNKQNNPHKEKEYRDYYDNGRNTYEAVYEEMNKQPSNSLSLLDNSRKGQKLLNFYDK